MSIKSYFGLLFQLFIFTLVISEQLQNPVPKEYSELQEIRRMCNENTKALRKLSLDLDAGRKQLQEKDVAIKENNKQLEKVMLELEFVQQKLREKDVELEIMKKNVKLGTPM